MSASTFKRHFKSIYNQSPGKYLLDKKLEQGSYLLMNTNKRMSEIAYDCGFGDLSNFSKAFSKKYGMSPREYQKSHPP